MNKDVYVQITEQIIKAIEAGAEDFEMPWHKINALPTNARTGKRYQGVNILSLCASANTYAYSSSTWATYKQWSELGAQVRKGAKGTMIVFYKVVGKEQDSEQQQEEKSQSSTKIFANASYVFNAEQVDGYTPPSIEVPTFNQDNRIDSVEEFFNSLGADINHGGNKAFYSSSNDKVQMPPFEMFYQANGYYSVLAHEITHWTAHPSRCNRDLTGRFGTESYAGEELVAELGAAFLCSLLKISNEPRKDHASYITSWLTLLKKDPKAIFTASSKAQQAIDWLEHHSNSNSYQTHIPNLQTSSTSARLHI